MSVGPDDSTASDAFATEKPGAEAAGEQATSTPRPSAPGEIAGHDHPPETGLSPQMARKLQKKLERQRQRRAERIEAERHMPREAFRTADFWESRYAGGGHSGIGSYGVLGQYKADVVNAFVRDRGAVSVIEHGCGDGHQASLFEIPKYVGYDISRTAVEKARQRNGDRSNFEFYFINDLEISDRAYDLALSLDVIFHLVEDELYEEHMARLFKSADRYVIVYCTNYDRDSEATHMRHRQFTRWVSENATDWSLDKVIKNPYSAEGTPAQHRSKADFHFFSRRQPV